MVAGPVPLEGVTCKNDALLAAVHVHPVSPESLKLPPCDSAEILAEFGLSAKLQGGPACVMVTLCEPTVIMPVREGDSLFAVTVKPADVLMLEPVCPKVIVIQLTFEITVLGQGLPLATMSILPSPPEIGNDCGEALSLNVQVCAARTLAKASATKARRATVPRTIAIPL